MAKKVIQTTEYTDDLDGSNAAGTVTFGFEGNQYEIDLSKSNTRAFEKALKPYVDAARKVRGSRGRPAGRGRSSGSKRDLGAIRSWAREQGIDVSDRGRVSGDVIARYEAAH